MTASVKWPVSNIPSRAYFESMIPTWEEPILFIGWDDKYTGFYKKIKKMFVIDIIKDKGVDMKANILTDEDIKRIIKKNPNKFKTVVCNGIIGWGVDDVSNIKKMFKNISNLLQPNGMLLVGWNTKIYPEMRNDDRYSNITKTLTYSIKYVSDLLKGNYKIKLLPNIKDSYHHRFIVATKKR